MGEEKRLDISYLKTPLAIFMIRGIALFLLWDLIFYPYLIPDSFHSHMVGYLLDFSRTLLNAFHLEAGTTNGDLFINGIRTVHVGIPCDGIEAMGVFSCIVIAFHSKWFHKVWIILAGMAIIFLLNGVRIVLLAWLIAAQHLTAFNINHKYFFNIALYTVLLAILFLWSSKFAIKKEKVPVD